MDKIIYKTLAECATLEVSNFRYLYREEHDEAESDYTRRYDGIGSFDKPHRFYDTDIPCSSDMFVIAIKRRGFLTALVSRYCEENSSCTEVIACGDFHLYPLYLIEGKEWVCKRMSEDGIYFIFENSEDYISRLEKLKNPERNVSSEDSE